MKKIIFLLLFTLIGWQWVIAQTFTVGGINYNVTSETTVEVSSQNGGVSGAVTIPAQVTNNSIVYSVTRIGNNAFNINNSAAVSALTSITMPNSIISIGNSAFYACRSITSVIIPNSVISIEDSAFYACIGLTSVTIGESVTSIGNNAFRLCFFLPSLIIPNSVQSIGNAAFADCYYLVNPIIGNSVTTIGASAFSRCDSLALITIPNSVTTIGANAFSGSMIYELNIGNSVTSVGVNAFCVINLRAIYCDIATPLVLDMIGPSILTTPDCGSFVFTSSVELHVPYYSIPAYQQAPLWRNCTICLQTLPPFREVDPIYCGQTPDLSTENVPYYVNSIYEPGTWSPDPSEPIFTTTTYTFTPDKSFLIYCIPPQFVTVEVVPEPVPTFTQVPPICSGATLSALPTTSLNGIVGTWSPALDNTTTTTYTFTPNEEYCTSTTTLEIVVNTAPTSFSSGGLNYILTSPTTVAVGNNSGASGSIVIPSSVTTDCGTFEVTSIGDSAFSGCNFLTSIAIPNSITNIGTYAFGYCDSLTTVNIPNSVSSIGDSAFEGSGLTSVILPNSITTINSFAFFGCTSLLSIVIPNSVTSIGDYAFAASGLLSINIPNSVTSIGAAFSNCTFLQFLTIPNSVTSIGDYAFTGCSSLTSINIPNSVTSIGDYALASSGLLSINIPNSVTSIGDYAFSYCTSLTSVNIPNSVTSIGTEAFSNCTSLTSVTCDIITPLLINQDVFEGVNQGACTLNVPSGSVTLYQVAPVWTDFNIPFTIPTTLTFCQGAKVSDAVGTTSLKFYTALTKGTLLLGEANLSTRTVYATQTVNGIESSPRVPVSITVNPLPLTLATLTTTDTVLCKYIGTENIVTYTAASGASSYIWSVPEGVSVKSGQGTNQLVVDFSTSTASGIFPIGRIGVKAVDTNGCVSAAAKSISLSTKFPIAPKTLTITNAGILEGNPIKKIGSYLGTTTEFTLTAEIAPTAHHYRWLLPSGVNQVGGSSTSNVITVNFSGVSGVGDLPISVYSVGGCGESIARTLILRRVEPKAPSALVLTALESNQVTLPIDILNQIKKVGPYVGTSTVLTLVATPITIQGSTATSYEWEFPSGVTSYRTTTTTVGDVTTISSTSNIITVDFAGVGTTILSLPITVYAVNGAGKSVPRILNLTSAAPTTPGLITTPIATVPIFNPICNSTITVQVPSVFGVTYNWTVGSGATILSGNGTNLIEIDVSTVTTNSILVSVVASNGTGQSATRSLTIKKAVTCRESASNGVAQEFNVIAYPNPSSSDFIIESSAKGAMSVKVYDMQGRLVEKADTNKVGSRLAAGTYNVIVNQGANTKSVRVIKK